MSTPIEKLLNDIERTTAEVFSLEQLRERLTKKNKLTIKFGADVTAPFLHLGHAVNLWMMRRFQEDGHKVVFLLGDFTTRIGDPTGKSETRGKIPQEDIEKFGQEFVNQISKILITDNPEVFEVRRNSDWFDKMSVDRFLSLMSLTTHARLISRDMFQKRISEEKDIYSHELIYPILQGYDSYELNSDLTIVGSDQLFNEMMGKFYQEKFGQDPQIIITSKITPGLHGGPKQSKSLNNYVAIVDSPRDMYGKIMSLKDELVIDWLKVYTNVEMAMITSLEDKLKNGENPVNAKHFLAFEIVRRYHGEEVAKNEQNWFMETFSKKSFPDNAEQIKIASGTYDIISFLKLLRSDFSNSELRRLIKQNAITINDKKYSNEKDVVNSDGSLEVKIGKRIFIKVITE